MPDFVHYPRLLAALGLTVSMWAAAQPPGPPMNDAERARRDAEKVFSFIKFQTVRSKPAEPVSKPARAPAPSAVRPARAVPPTDAATAAGAPTAQVAPSPAAGEPVGNPTTPTAAVATPAPQAAPPASVMTAPTSPATAATAATTAAAPSEPMPQAATSTEAESENDEHDPDDASLQLQNFVAPVLTPAVQATLGAGARNIKVRFTVEANGKVSSAEAAAGVPRRLAKPATDAILQWQFAPLPQARTADVEIAFRRD